MGTAIRRHPPVDVLVVDDDHVFADALVERLSAEPGVRTVAPTYSVEGARRRLHERRADVVLLDHNLGEGGSSSRLLEELVAQPNPPVVLVLSGSQNVSDIAHAIDTGAAGWLVKGITVPNLLAALGEALAGELVLPDGAVGSLVHYLLDELHERGTAV